MEGKSVTSRRRTSMLREMPPSEANLSNCPRLERLRMVVTTRYPLRASSSAVNIPIPPELPVTTATFCMGLGSIQRPKPTHHRDTEKEKLISKILSSCGPCLGFGL